jgi:hypothetical protein
MATAPLAGGKGFISRTLKRDTRLSKMKLRTFLSELTVTYTMARRGARLFLVD